MAASPRCDTTTWMAWLRAAPRCTPTIRCCRRCPSPRVVTGPLAASTPRMPPSRTSTSARLASRALPRLVSRSRCGATSTIPAGVRGCSPSRVPPTRGGSLSRRTALQCPSSLRPALTGPCRSRSLTRSGTTWASSSLRGARARSSWTGRRTARVACRLPLARCSASSCGRTLMTRRRTSVAAWRTSPCGPARSPRAWSSRTTRLARSTPALSRSAVPTTTQRLAPTCSPRIRTRRPSPTTPRF